MMLAICSPSRAARGFTLIELAIVLVVIGLLVGGILFGMEMHNAARVRSVIKEKEQLEIQINVFKLNYSALPGDFADAKALFSGCADGGNNHCNGDGNGRIGESYAPNLGEVCRIWEHMKRSGLLQNQNLSYVNQNAGYCTSPEAPKSAYHELASWYMGSTDQGCTDYSGCTTNRNYFMFVSGSVFGRNMSGGASIVSPPNASAVDMKMDDGRPLTGLVLAANNISPAASAPYAVQNRYCLYDNGAPGWIYYTGYSGDMYGCRMIFRANFSR